MRSLQILFLALFGLVGVGSQTGCYEPVYTVRPACNAVWVPAHRGYWGRWHPGHWRCM
jgi:hypothetical protein